MCVGTRTRRKRKKITHVEDQVRHVPSTKAVPNRGVLLDTLLLQRSNELVHRGPRDVLSVLAKPLAELVVVRLGVSVAVEVVRHVDGDVGLGGVRVGEEETVGLVDAVDAGFPAKRSGSDCGNWTDWRQATHSVRKRSALLFS